MIDNTISDKDDSDEIAKIDGIIIPG